MRSKNRMLFFHSEYFKYALLIYSLHPNSFVLKCNALCKQRAAAVVHEPPFRHTVAVMPDATCICRPFLLRDPEKYPAKMSIWSRNSFYTKYQQQRAADIILARLSLHYTKFNSINCVRELANKRWRRQRQHQQQRTEQKNKIEWIEEIMQMLFKWHKRWRLAHE